MENITQNTQVLIDSEMEYQRMAQAINPYGDGKASQRVVKVILQYLFQGEY